MIKQGWLYTSVENYVKTTRLYIFIQQPKCNMILNSLQLILDHSALNCYIPDGSHGQLHSIEFHCRRLCHALHTERYKLKGAKKKKVTVNPRSSQRQSVPHISGCK